jgi:hypothetical protein
VKWTRTLLLMNGFFVRQPSLSVEESASTPSCLSFRDFPHVAAILILHSYTNCMCLFLRYSYLMYRMNLKVIFQFLQISHYHLGNRDSSDCSDWL